MDRPPFSSLAALVFLLSQVLPEEDQQLSSKPRTEKNQSTREAEHVIWGKPLEKAAHMVRINALREL